MANWPEHCSGVTSTIWLLLLYGMCMWHIHANSIYIKQAIKITPVSIWHYHHHQYILPFILYTVIIITYPCIACCVQAIYEIRVHKNCVRLKFHSRNNYLHSELNGLCGIDSRVWLVALPPPRIPSIHSTNRFSEFGNPI